MKRLLILIVSLSASSSFAQIKHVPAPVMPPDAIPVAVTAPAISPTPTPAPPANLVVCISPVEIIAGQDKAVSVLIVDEAMKTVSFSVQSKHAITYGRTATILSANKSEGCLTYVLNRNSKTPESNEAVLNVDLVQKNAVYETGPASPTRTVYSACVEIGPNNYLAVSNYIKRNL